MKQQRRLRQAAAPSAAALAMSLAACEGTVETVQLTAAQLEQVEEQVEIAEKEGLQLVEAMIERGDHWFGTEGLQADSDRMIKEVQKTVQLLRNLLDAKKIRGFNAADFNTAAAFADDKGRQKREYIAIKVEPDGKITPLISNLTHEVGHLRTFRDRGAFVDAHAHNAVVNSAYVEYSDNLGQLILQEKDFPFLMTLLFDVPVFLNWQMEVEIEKLIGVAKDIVETTDHEIDWAQQIPDLELISYTPQQAYDYIREQKRKIGSNAQDWVEFEFGIRNQDIIYASNVSDGSMHSMHLPSIGNYFIPLQAFGLNQKEIMESAIVSGLWELREQKWEQAIDEFVDSFPDGAIETVEEQAAKEGGQEVSKEQQQINSPRPQEFQRRLK